MNRYLLIFGILLIVCSNKNNAQNLNSDTTIINYSIAHGELGCTNEGLIIYQNATVLRAKYIKYNASSYGIPLKTETIISFYKRNRTNYSVLKEEWVLNSQQVNYLNDLLVEIKNYHSRGFSNAPEHYAILRKNQWFVLIDSTGKWNKFLEIKKEI